MTDLELTLAIEKERTRQVEVAQGTAIKQAQVAANAATEQARLAASAKSLPWRIGLTILLWLLLAGVIIAVLLTQEATLIPVTLVYGSFLGAIGTGFIFKRS